MRFYLFILLCLFNIQTNAQKDSLPNLLLVIADDLGVDMLNGYGFGGLKPTTPTLDSLRGEGITFDNVWSAPACTPTRASIMSGKYGIKTGVLKAPGNLDTSHTSVFKALPKSYSSALVGKWHISFPLDLNHPGQHGVPYYAGEMQAGVRSYNDWDLVENGVSNKDSNYVTSVFTNKSMDWLKGRSDPWLLWLAHVAPHAPFHTPPAHMYTLGSVGTNFRKYVAMIESFDYELNRLIHSIPDSVMKNTIVIVIGDNGTPGNFTQDYPPGHGKGTLYEGAVRVPMVIAGKNVDRKGEREKALIHVCDLYSTMLEIAGVEQKGGMYNSLSFAHLLNSNTLTNAPTRDYNYSEIASTVNGWTIRDKQYKLIEFSNGTQEFYDLLMDSLETNNIISQLTIEQRTIKADLEKEAQSIRTSWSYRDHIQNGDETGIDCGGSSCISCETSVEEEQKTNWKVYPNPAENRLHIQSPLKDLVGFKVTLHSISGQLLYDKTYNGSFEEVQIDLSSISTQQLFLSIENQAGELLLREKVIRTGTEN